MSHNKKSYQKPPVKGPADYKPAEVESSKKIDEVPKKGTPAGKPPQAATMTPMEKEEEETIKNPLP